MKKPGVPGFVWVQGEALDFLFFWGRTSLKFCDVFGFVPVLGLVHVLRVCPVVFLG